MYYAKFKLGTAVQGKWNIQISNNIVVLTNGTNINILTNGIIKDDYIYLPLEKNNFFYYVKFLSSDFKNYIAGGFKSQVGSEVTSINKTTICDEDLNEIGIRYYYIVGYEKQASFIFLENPNTIYSYYNVTASGSYGSSTSYRLIPKNVYSQTSIPTKFTINLSTFLTNMVNGTATYPLLGKVSYNFRYQCFHGGWYFGNTRVNSTYGFTMVISSKNIIFFSDFIKNNPLGIYDDIEQDTSVSFVSGFFNIVNDLDKESIEVYKANNDCIVLIPKKGNSYIDTDNIVTIHYSTSSTSLGLYMLSGYYDSDYSDFGTNIQDEYTPTNKLQTLTFSDLEVLHNEESGTFALTFKINNPNEVSVSTNIHISGREDITDITAPPGTSEWSYIIEENKDGTIQATDISALGYENADDSATYKYLAWIEPGYLRELAISNVFLSTINDKNYILNIFVTNNNSVSIPAILHYGKTSELTKSITLKSGFNSIYVSNVENTNGSIWIHPESISGYYPLPDTDAVSYNKLPIPPVPSSTGITLFKNNNNNKVVNKGYKLETYKILNGTFRDEVNILNPTFQIENDEVPDCNYCYIADFRRYYYIDSITCIRTGLYELQCSVDVLYTYKDNILSSEQYVSRQENDYNELLVDGMVTFGNDYTFTYYEKHLDFLDYANIEYSLTSPIEGLTNIVISVTEDATNMEI